MRTNVNLFWVLAGFFFLADAIYIAWGFLDPAQGRVEWVGALAIGLTGVLAAFIAYYLGRVYKSQGGELPEDRLDARIEDGDAEQGHFSPFSWWPPILGASVATVFLGVAIGPWLAFIGAAVVVIALVGWVYEYYRGYFVR
jgi:hypothetical protein